LVLLVIALVVLKRRGTSIGITSLIKLGRGTEDALLVAGKTIDLPRGPVSTFDTIDRPITDGYQEYRTFLINVFFANYWQLVVSIISTLCNTVFIRLVIGYEWQNSFGADHPKSVRVSYPQGAQRSGYLISMPWKYGTAFLVLQILLSWMVSQSIYVLKVDAFFYNREQDSSSSISACAYGPIFLVIGRLSSVVSLWQFH
jgi:hypothetical protein